MVKYLPVAIGLSSIPFIVHPIDHFTDYLLDNTYRKILTKDWIKHNQFVIHFISTTTIYTHMYTCVQIKLVITINMICTKIKISNAHCGVV